MAYKQKIKPYLWKGKEKPYIIIGNYESERGYPACIECGKTFEEKEGFTVAEGYDTGVCSPCREKLGERKFAKLIKKVYGEEG